MEPRKTMATILAVDDAEDTLELLRRNLEGIGHRVHCARGVPEALELLGRRRVDLVITDLRMPGMSGLDLVRHVRANLRDTEILMITGFPSVGGAVEAMRSGAADYLSKPFTTAELREAVGRVLERQRARRALEGARAPEGPTLPDFVAGTETMRAVVSAILEHAAHGEPILIEGEPGTGRRTTALQIHWNGARAAGPFMGIDCALWPPERLREILRDADAPGAREGAHTPGWLWRSARGGTLLIHDAHALPADVQPELRRMLEEHAAAGVRGGATRPPVRWIFDSSVELGSAVARRSFLAPLHARIAARRIELPPLRERGDDVIDLIRHFASQASRQLGIALPMFTDRAIAVMWSYAWPGNLTELRDTVLRVVIAAGGRTVDAPDLPPHVRGRGDALDRTQLPLADVEAEHIRAVLAGTKGNRSHAARILGIDRKTLREKLRRMG